MTEPLFDITWDDAKAQRNVLKHGLSFAQAATVMLDPRGHAPGTATVREPR